MIKNEKMIKMMRLVDENNFEKVKCIPGKRFHGVKITQNIKNPAIIPMIMLIRESLNKKGWF
jgi:hypothetical protein